MRKSKQIAIKTSQDFLMSNVKVFIKNKYIEEMSVTNEYGAILLRRNISEKSTKIVGFAESTDYEEDEGATENDTKI